MHYTFLSAYQAIKTGKLSPQGLWLVHGDDVLVQSWLIDALRPCFVANNQLIERIHLNSPKDWQNAIATLSDVSLFGDSTAIILTGKQKSDKTILDKLSDFAQDASTGNSTHCLVYQLPKQDKKEQASKLFGVFAKFGVVVDCQVYDEKTRQAMLAQKAQEFGLSLEPSAWQMLMEHTENHLLSAYQALWRLADLYAPTHTTDSTPVIIDSQELLAGLVDDYQYSVFNLCDTVLLGDGVKAVQILHTLRQVGTAPSIVLWGIAKEVRLVLQLPHQSFDSLGIWRNKIPLYQKAVARHSFDTQALDDLYEIDKAIKGLTFADPWQLLQALCLKLCLGS